MGPRAFITWLLITIAMVILATFVVLDKPTANFDPVSRKPVFADLRKSPDSVSKIEIKSRFGSFSIERSDEMWRTPDKFGYRVDESNVRRLVISLSDMRYIERKTSRPDRFSRLEVEDIDGEESESAYVRMTNSQGEVLAESIIGRPSARFIDGAVSGNYIREPGTNNVWLVSGLASVQTRLVPWLDGNIVSISAEKVKKVTLSGPEGKLTLVRKNPKKQELTLEKANIKAKLDDEKVNSIKRAMADINLEDVKPKKDVILLPNARVAKFLTFSGISITAKLQKLDKQNWVIFIAKYEKDKSHTKDVEDSSRKKVDEINKRVKDWAYWIPSNDFDILTYKLKDIIKETKDKSS